MDELTDLEKKRRLREVELEKKWIDVQYHYERFYHVKFKERLNDEDIDHLHQKMKRLNSEISNYLWEKNLK